MTERNEDEFALDVASRIKRPRINIEVGRLRLDGGGRLNLTGLTQRDELFELTVRYLKVEKVRNYKIKGEVIS